MASVNRYLLQNFTSSFASLFMTLFFIMSIIFFIQIAKITSIIQITFLELGKLYLFMLPKIFLFTIPISFFIATTLMFFRLSRENETIVFFTLGYTPKSIAKFFIGISFLLSSALLINSVILIPLSKQLNTNFIDYKRMEAKLNIKATEFGQKFSDWLVFMDSSKESEAKRAYKDIVMYKSKSANTQERIILANSADIINKKGELTLNLDTGKAYEVAPNSLHQVSFKKMIINTQPNKKIQTVSSIWNYWQEIYTNPKRAKNFALYILISLFPLASILFALSFGIVTYRYEKGGIYGGIFGVIFAYFAGIMLMGKSYPLLSIFLVSSLCFALSFFMFKKKILSRY